ncbi:MAG: hypothetical protein ACRD1N_01205 [Terriglobia bacterium]
MRLQLTAHEGRETGLANPEAIRRGRCAIRFGSNEEILGTWSRLALLFEGSTQQQGWQSRPRPVAPRERCPARLHPSATYRAERRRLGVFCGPTPAELPEFAIRGTRV